MDEEKPRKSHTAIWIYSSLAALLLYVLASGPLEAFAFVNGYLGMNLDKWNWLYAPLVKVTEVTGTRGWLVRYCNWWEDVMP